MAKVSASKSAAASGKKVSAANNSKKQVKTSKNQPLKIQKGKSGKTGSKNESSPKPTKKDKVQKKSVSQKTSERNKSTGKEPAKNKASDSKKKVTSGNNKLTTAKQDNSVLKSKKSIDDSRKTASEKPNTETKLKAVSSEASKKSLEDSKKEKLQQMLSEREGAEEPQKLISAPTDKMLKPFRDAAKRNSEAQQKKKKAEKRATFVAKPLKNGKKYSVDLRVHTPISEGYFSTGGVDPAAAMVRLAKSKGLDMIAVTDYHTADFVDAVKDKAKETSITVLPGIDLRCSVGTCDEVCLIALFPEEYSSSELNKIINLLGIPDNARGRKAFTLREELKKVIEVVEANGGVLIPSRLDKSPSRTFAIRPLIEEHGFHAFDLVHPENPEFFKQNWPSGEFTFLSFSNANALGQIGSRGMTVRLPSPGFNGLKTLFARRKSANI